MTRLRLVTDATTCAHCRAPVEKGAEFCENCEAYWDQLRLDAALDIAELDESPWYDLRDCDV